MGCGCTYLTGPDPDLTAATLLPQWFRWYKTPDDKPLNGFGFDEAWLSADKTVEVIGETHAAWKGLRDGSIEKGKLWNGV